MPERAIKELPPPQLSLDLFGASGAPGSTLTLSGQTGDRLDIALGEIMAEGRDLFLAKEYSDESDEVDLLMAAYHITQMDKRSHRQFFGQTLGRRFEKLVLQLLGETHQGFLPPPRRGSETPCDCLLGSMALELKYRFGSGDGRTVGKIRDYGLYLRSLGLEPKLLVLRTDSMQASIGSLRRGGWEVFEGDATLDFLHLHTGFDLRRCLIAMRDSGRYSIKPPSQQVA